MKGLKSMGNNTYSHFKLKKVESDYEPQDNELFLQNNNGIVQLAFGLNNRACVVQGDSNNNGVNTETYIEHTYEELETLKNSGSLVVGQKYLLTDYRTIYNGACKDSPLTKSEFENICGKLTDTTLYEPLILTASTTDSFSLQATSIQYPNDIIHYEFYNVSNDVYEVGSDSDETRQQSREQLYAACMGRPGYIVYREDPIKHLSAYYDWRIVKWYVSFGIENIYPNGSYFLTFDDESERNYVGVESRGNILHGCKDCYLDNAQSCLLHKSTHNYFGGNAYRIHLKQGCSNNYICGGDRVVFGENSKFNIATGLYSSDFLKASYCNFNNSSGCMFANTECTRVTIYDSDMVYGSVYTKINNLSINNVYDCSLNGSILELEENLSNIYASSTSKIVDVAKTLDGTNSTTFLEIPIFNNTNNAFEVGKRYIRLA